ncbi:MAG: glycosyltransferase family 4 protein [Ignavibacteriales bacterium]|nr:glycosyltransferase family 4 protein [Ignavibacteriales bacterium]
MIDKGNAPPHTGIGNYSDGIIHALQTYCSEQIDVIPCPIYDGNNSLRPVRRLKYLFRLRKLSKEMFRGADVVHFTNVFVPPRILNTAYVVTIHDLDAIVYPQTYSWSYRMYYKNIIKHAVSRADIILTVSQTVKILLENRYPGVVDKIRVIANGLSPTFMSLVDDNISRHEFATPIMLFVGSLSKKKNTPWLVRTTINGIRNGIIPKMKLVLAGAAGFGFQEIAPLLEYENDIVHWVPNPDLPHLVSLYRESNLVILPSQTEGFGIPLLEAMYCKKPIVASDIPSSREVAGDAACFFELGNMQSFYDAIIDALNDRNRVKRNLLIDQKLPNYFWQNLAKEFCIIYKEAQCRH